ncbi:helix-turn-helix transcriptional regulator [Corynebacterium uterequi]|uniref:Putative transcriptional regulator n=1 Tax=Corynebacterium uterequi TaxID=1072256 RepID=A0A0G3HIU5_9CORY|nr:WYL domain-containing protein [Corynebacterium uterequi]AKK11082.1 putative transcriptional regulator [Corynebacterium uterequi]
MARYDSMLGRQVNLTFALLNETRPRSYSWVLNNVDGYEDIKSENTVARDIKALRATGVPIRVDKDRRVALNVDSYALTPIEFNADEANTIAIAGQLGHDSALGAFANSGWTKLAASGAERDFASARTGHVPRLTKENDVIRINPDIIERLLMAIKYKLSITFSYHPAGDAPAQHRRMDPWSLVPLDGRLYLVGHDLDRDDTRCFRAIRVSDVNSCGKSTHAVPEKSLVDVVRENLQSFRVLVDVRLRVAEGVATEFGQPVDGIIELSQVNADDIARTAAAYAPGVIVESPESVREHVINLLREAQRS